MDSSFEKELEFLLNKHSFENKSDTPDFILAEYIGNALNAFNDAINLREKWYGRKKHIPNNTNDNLTIGHHTTGNPSTFQIPMNEVNLEDDETPNPTLKLPDNAKKKNNNNHNYLADRGTHVLD